MDKYRIFAIDPSINYLGWAVMELDTVVASGTINASVMQKADFVERLGWMTAALQDVVEDFEFDHIVIERPEQWGAYKSMASGASGSLQMLTLIVGALTYWAVIMSGVENTRLITVTQWKGQTPKHITKRRMEEKYHTRFKTDHEADAVGIGSYFLGVVNGTKERSTNNV